MAYTISASGIKLLEEFEGCILHPYKDKKGIPTIGIGSTFYPGGRKVSMKDPEISRFQALQYARNVIDKTIAPVIKKLVKVPIKQKQLDALICFAYNVGIGKDGFAGSHLLLAINAGRPCSEIQAEFNRWIYVGGIVSDWQIYRRKREGNLFCS